MQIGRLIFAMLLAFTTFAANANFQSDLLKAKVGNRVSSQWTLADWLAQKNKMALADQWLALNRSANIFDVSLSGGLQDFKLETKNASGTVSADGKSQNYQMDLYISIFNLYGEYEKTDSNLESFAGAAGLRVFGTSSQTTSLILRYGFRDQHHLKTLEKWQNQFAEGVLQLYVIQQFGLQGKYRHYFPDTSKQGNKLEGHRVTAGAFLEFGIFRLYGDFYQEPIEKTNAGVATKENRNGLEYGLRLML